jgi:hypothetical protein
MVLLASLLHARIAVVAAAHGSYYNPTWRPGVMVLERCRARIAAP